LGADLRSKPPDHVSDVLSKKLKERAAVTALKPHEAFAKDLEDTVEQLLKASQGSPDLLNSLISEVKALFEKQRALALRHRGR
jgi:hypothetical protein